MIHDKMYDLYYPCDIHYICDDIDMQWCITLHMHRDIAFHGCECMVEIKRPQLVVDKWARYCWTKLNRVTRSHDMENLCRIIARRARHSLG